MNALAFEGKIEELRQLASSTELSSFRDSEDSGRGVLLFAVLGKQTELLSILLNEFNCSPEVYDEVRLILFVLLNLLFFRMIGVLYMWQQV